MVILCGRIMITKNLSPKVAEPAESTSDELSRRRDRCSRTLESQARTSATFDDSHRFYVTATNVAYAALDE